MSPQTQGTAQEEQAIRDLITKFVAAWNKGDGKVMATHFTTDADVIDPGGRIARGRKEVEQMFQDEQAGVFKGTHFSMPFSHLRFLKPDIAIADNDFEIDGVNGPVSTLKGMVTLVVRKDGDKWLITSARPMVPVRLPN
jgi:uncharacterized protein (TIGR02246 family)